MKISEINVSCCSFIIFLTGIRNGAVQVDLENLTRRKFLSKFKRDFNMFYKIKLADFVTRRKC